MKLLLEKTTLTPYSYTNFGGLFITIHWSSLDATMAPNFFINPADTYQYMPNKTILCVSAHFIDSYSVPVHRSLSLCCKKKIPCLPAPKQLVAVLRQSVVCRPPRRGTATLPRTRDITTAPSDHLRAPNFIWFRVGVPLSASASASASSTDLREPQWKTKTQPGFAVSSRFLLLQR